jgi:hypothetical protein
MAQWPQKRKIEKKSEKLRILVLEDVVDWMIVSDLV